MTSSPSEASLKKAKFLVSPENLDGRGKSLIEIIATAIDQAQPVWPSDSEIEEAAFLAASGEEENSTYIGFWACALWLKWKMGAK